MEFLKDSILMKKTKIKLRKAISYNHFFACLFCFIIILTLGLSLSPFGIEWVYCFLVAIGAISLPLVIALIDFCFFKPYYLVDETGINKFIRKKLVLTVNKDEIQDIYCVKTKIRNKFLNPLWLLLGYFSCDTVSIKFSNDNEEYDYNSYSRFGLGTRNLNDISNDKINTDLLSNREALKLASILGKELKYINSISKL